MEKNIKIKYDGKDEEVIIGEITWEQKTDAIKKSIKDVQRGRQMKREVDTILQKELMMCASIKKAPFEICPASLKKLSSKDGERIYNVYSELNELDEDEESPGEE